MIFTPQKIHDLLLIDTNPVVDERGSFSRTFCEREFAQLGIEFHIAQINNSQNDRRGTLRGLHYQKEPHSEQKIVCCQRGKLFDVAVDIRPNSTTRFSWVGVELSAANGRMLYIPEGFAHGFVTLEDNTEVQYLMGQYYYPEAAAGFRYDDPIIGINWPEVGELTVSEKDRRFLFL